MQLSFVTGKGGVGKTRLTLLLAKKEPNVVLAENTVALAGEAEKLQLKPPPIYHFSRSDLAEEFLVSTLKIKAIAKWLSKSHLFQALLSLAPNLHELLLFRQWLNLSKEDSVIVDAPSTGHFLAIFDAVKTAQEVFDGGSLRLIANEIDSFLQKNEITIYIVTLPEKSAINEMNEIVEGVRKYYSNIKIKKILNRKHSKPLAQAEISKELKEFGLKRATHEEERTKSIDFDLTIAEGALSI